MDSWSFLRKVSTRHTHQLPQPNTPLKAQLDINSKTKTDKDKPKNLAHSENNALDETKTTGVLIFVLFTIITVLALTIYLAVLKKQNGAYEITKRQDIESHEMT